MYTRKFNLAAAAGCAILLMTGCAAQTSSAPSSTGSGGTAAPSSPSAAGGGGGTLDACKLLTDSDLSTFTGTMGNKPGTPSGDGCTFQLSSTASATVTPKTITKADFDSAMSSQGGTSTPGIGDEAFAQIGGDPVIVWAWQDGVEITASVQGGSPEAAASVANAAFYNILLSK